MMTVKERLLTFISYKRLSQKRFEESAGMANGYVNNIRRSISPDKLKSIGMAFPELNTGWLITGEGDMLKPNALTIVSNNVEKKTLRDLIRERGGKLSDVAEALNITIGELNRYNDLESMSTGDLEKVAKALNINFLDLVEGVEKMKQHNINLRSPGVPYYDIDVTASIVRSFSDIPETPDYFVDFRPFNDCTAYLPIYGDSMYPQFCSGEIIAVKEWLNTGVILWGEPYLIITNEDCNNLRTVKLIFPHEETDKIVLRASNPNYKGDTIVKLDSIISLFIVKGKITRKQL